MRATLHRQFGKQFVKLSEKQKKQFYKRRNLFLKDPFHPLLNNHRLSGEMKEYRSINITGDLRVLYQELDSKNVLFVKIDTHSNLY